jgi:hypothetical protein
MPKTNLSLGNLHRAASGSVRTGAVSLAGLAGSAANSSLSSFAIDAVSVNLPIFTYIVESTDESGSFSFTSAGTLHGTKVATIANNYTCSFSNANFTVPSSTLGSSPTFTIRPAAINVSSYSEAESQLTMKYEDGYNLAATNYNSTSTKVLYAVDVYNTINQPDFCLLFGTKVTLTNGTEINIEDLNVGDEITFSDANGKVIASSTSVCPDGPGGFGCSAGYSVLISGTQYVYLTIDGSNIC